MNKPTVCNECGGSLVIQAPQDRDIPTIELLSMIVQRNKAFPSGVTKTVYEEPPMEVLVEITPDHTATIRMSVDEFNALENYMMACEGLPT